MGKRLSKRLRIESESRESPRGFPHILNSESSEKPFWTKPGTTTTPTLLILTLYCGENDYTLQREALSNQTFKTFEQVTFSYLPNLQAHQKLYSTIMENSDSFDYFLKLDADMVPSRSTALQDMLEFAIQRPDVDHFRFPLDDFFTGRLIPDVHLFSNRVYWHDVSDPLFVDPSPIIPGLRLTHRDYPAPFLTHAPNPSEEQSFQFGVHRAFKAFQLNREQRNLTHVRLHYEVLTDAFHCWRSYGDRRHLLVVAGADAVLKGRIPPHAGYKLGPAVTQVFQSIAHRPDHEIANDLKSFWFTSLERRIRLWHTSGWRRLLAPPFKTMKRTLKRPLKQLRHVLRNVLNAL